jgi:hypothetical protein
METIVDTLFGREMEEITMSLKLWIGYEIQ